MIGSITTMHRHFLVLLQPRDAAREMIGLSKRSDWPSEKRVLHNFRLDKRRKDALKGDVPHITHNNHTTYAHQKCHQEIDRIIIQQTKPALDISACLTIAFLVMRPRANRHLCSHTKRQIDLTYRQRQSSSMRVLTFPPPVPSTIFPVRVSTTLA